MTVIYRLSLKLGRTRNNDCYMYNCYRMCNNFIRKYICFLLHFLSPFISQSLVVNICKLSTSHELFHTNFHQLWSVVDLFIHHKFLSHRVVKRTPRGFFVKLSILQCEAPPLCRKTFTISPIFITCGWNH